VHYLLDFIFDWVSYTASTNGGHDMVDRTQAAQALAKCIAYKACGKPAEARQWFLILTDLLGFKVTAVEG
jgi:hypothetical protein